MLTYCGSRLAVASSTSNILLFRSSARAKQINCFCPTLKLAPASVILKSSFSGSSSTVSLN